jgi:hypothetical protein
MRESFLHKFAPPRVALTYPVHAPALPRTNQAARTAPQPPFQCQASGIAGDVAAWRFDPSSNSVILESLSFTISYRGARLALPTSPLFAPVVLAVPPSSLNQHERNVVSVVVPLSGFILRAIVDFSNLDPTFRSVHHVVVPSSLSHVTLITSLCICQTRQPDSKEQHRSTPITSRCSGFCESYAVSFASGQCACIHFAPPNAPSPSAPPLCLFMASLSSSHQLTRPSVPDPIIADNASVVPSPSAPDFPPLPGRLPPTSSSIDSPAAAATPIPSRSLFISRLFGSRFPPTPLPSQSSSAVPSNRDASPTDVVTSDDVAAQLPPGKASRPLHPHPPAVDPVVAMLRFPSAVPVFVTLHASSRLCAYTLAPSPANCFALAAQVTLPVSLAANALQFMEPASTVSLFAILTVDQDPQPHALCVFAITLNVEESQEVTMACHKVMHRNGPIDRVVGAVLVPSSTNLAVATNAGQISVLPLPDLLPQPISSSVYSCIEQGLPIGTVWALQTDLSERNGLWHAVDGVQDLGIADRLLAANRFSAASIGKALRLPHLANAERHDVERVVIEYTRNCGSEEATRLLLRAQRASVVLDTPISSISFVPGAGVVVSRSCGLLVLRELFGDEDALLPQICQSVPTARAAGRIVGGQIFCLSEVIATCIAVHVAAQLASVDLLRSALDSDVHSSAACFLSLYIRTSQIYPDRMVGELAANWKRSNVSASGGDSEGLVAAVESAQSVLVPGGMSLRSMAAIGEWRALRDVAERSAKALPISCLFALGLVFLSECEATGAPSQRFETIHAEPRTPASLQDDDGCLVNAYSSFVAASKFAGGLIHSGAHFADSEDVCCVVHLGTSSSATVDGGPSPDIFKSRLDFWLLERALRMMDRTGAIRAAAAIALEALPLAPTSKLYEMMRAAAFQRFLDVGDLNSALRTIVKQGSGGPMCFGDSLANEDDAAAVSDCLGLLVNAAVDSGQFAWLSSVHRTLLGSEYVAIALERRARSSGPLNPDYLRDGPFVRLVTTDVRHTLRSPSSPYEFLYVWHLARHDAAAAAQAALEWYERVSHQGLSQILAACSPDVNISSQSASVAALLLWTRMKMRALCAACTAVRRLPKHLQFVSRSRYSASIGGLGCEMADGIVDLQWLSRRHLLVRAQLLCLFRVMNGYPSLSTEYIVTHSERLLSDQDAGVNFAVSSLLFAPVSKDRMFTAVDLALSWLHDHGDLCMTQVIRTAAISSCFEAVSLSSSRCPSLSFATLRDILEMVSSAVQQGNSCARNWYLVAAEGALEGSPRSAGLPYWLPNVTAWGVSPQFASSNSEVGVVQASDACVGDPAGIVRLLLRFTRPAEAALTLISGLELKAELATANRSAFRLQIPHAAVNSTVEMLSDVSGDTSDSFADLSEKLMEVVRCVASQQFVQA